MAWQDADGLEIRIGARLSPIKGTQPGLPLTVRVVGPAHAHYGEQAMLCTIVDAAPHGHPVGRQFVVCRPNNWRLASDADGKGT